MSQLPAIDMTHRLITVHQPAHIDAAVLVLHGGGSRERAVPVSPTQLSVLRMVPIAHRLARAGRRRVAVFRLLNSVRGWDTTHTPVDDVRWALGELRERVPAGVPIGLVGHSLGGRAAILSADQAQVRCVVALAPWVYADDGDIDATGRDILIVHGTADRIADPARSQAVAERLRSSADSVRYIRVVGGKHAMLRRHAMFGRLTAHFTMATLIGGGRSRPTGALARSLLGEPIDV